MISQGECSDQMEKDKCCVGILAPLEDRKSAILLCFSQLVSESSQQLELLTPVYFLSMRTFTLFEGEVITVTKI